MASAYHMFAWVQEIVLRTYVAHFCAATGTVRHLRWTTRTVREDYVALIFSACVATRVL